MIAPQLPHEERRGHEPTEPEAHERDRVGPALIGALDDRVEQRRQPDDRQERAELPRPLRGETEVQPVTLPAELLDRSQRRLSLAQRRLAVQDAVGDEGGRRRVGQLMGRRRLGAPPDKPKAGGISTAADLPSGRNALPSRKSTASNFPGPHEFSTVRTVGTSTPSTAATGSSCGASATARNGLAF